MEENNGWTWGSWQVILLILNAAFGIILFEWSWSKSKRFRDPIKELDDLIPEWRRDDAKKWARWKFYPGAMTLMLPRLIFSLLLAVVTCTIIWIVLLGHPMDAQITGCRRRTLRIIYRVWALFLNGIMMFTFSYTKNLNMDDVDHYQEWLGPIEEQEKEKQDKK